ncbi:MAG: DUF4340 domain-containing protein [Deltaproteobacteria bacterium]|nr:DUF4340 domain-containing protein [Deltaproteobacteria bacterium]
MMLSRTTWTLLVVAGLLALLLVLPSGQDGSGLRLPTLPALDGDAITRVTFERAGQPIVIERQGDRWRLKQPLQAEADASALEALLRPFGQPVPMDARVDAGHLEDYALDDNEGVRFEVFTSEAVPVISMVVGRDVEGGSTLLRMAGSDDVYRARVGGASRFRKEASAWRNRSVLSLDDTLVSGLTVEGSGGVLTFQRIPAGIAKDTEASTESVWHLDGDPTFPVDQRTLDTLVRSLARLRAGEVHAPDFGSGWDRPRGAYEIALADGTTHRILVVPAPDGASGLARADDNPDVYRIGASWVTRLEEGVEAYRDRTLFDFPPEQVQSLVLEEGGLRVRIQQDPTTRLWRVAEPVSMEVDLRRALVATRTMGELRALAVDEDVDAATAGLAPPGARFEARLVDGTSRVLEVGAGFQEGGQDLAWVRRAGQDTIWVVPAEALKRMRAAFVQS